jgi:hypothetical protein
MKALGRFLNVIATLMLLIVGGSLLASSLGLVDISGYLFGRELLTGAIGAVMLIIGLVVVLIAVQNVRPEQTISIQSSEGELRIAFSAIEELLKKVSRGIRGVRELSPKVVGTKRGLEVRNRASIEAGVSIPEITTKIQELFRSQIREVLGIEEVGAIRTYVHKIITEEPGKEE